MEVSRQMVRWSLAEAGAARGPGSGCMSVQSDRYCSGAVGSLPLGLHARHRILSSLMSTRPLPPPSLSVPCPLVKDLQDHTEGHGGDGVGPRGSRGTGEKVGLGTDRKGGGSRQCP